MWNLKWDTKELIYGTEIDSDIENRLLVVKTEGVGETDWEFGISRCKLLYTHTHTHTHIYITESLSSTLENNTTLQIHSIK